MRYFFLLFLCGCSSVDILISSSYQQWVGGRQETGSGTNYTFTLIAPDRSNNFIITELYAQQHQLQFKMPKQFEKGDTLKIWAFKTDIKWSSDKNEAKICYEKKGEKFEIQIQEMTRLERLYYP